MDARLLFLGNCFKREPSMTPTQAVPPKSRGALKAVSRGIQTVDTLPQIVLRIMQVANDEKCGARDLKEAMECDPALSSRVLKLVNSSAYATRTKITNLQQAIAYLGIRQIRNLAVTASASKLFSSDEKIGSYTRTGLWKHLVSVGICARLLAMRLNLRDFEDIFLAGLLHDIGIVLADQHMHDPFCAAMNSLSEGEPLCAVERAQLGFDHTQLAEAVAETWGFPPGVTAAARYHHDTVSYRGESVTTIRCVEVANVICSLKGVTSVGMNLVRFPASTISALALTKDDIIVLAEDFDQEVVTNQSLFQI